MYVFVSGRTDLDDLEVPFAAPRLDKLKKAIRKYCNDLFEEGEEYDPLCFNDDTWNSVTDRFGDCMGWIKKVKVLK